MRVGIYINFYMGECQNYGPLWGALHIRCRIIIGTQKGTIILTTTHMYRTLFSEYCVGTFGEILGVNQHIILPGRGGGAFRMP